MCDIFNELFNIKNLNDELVEYETGEDFSYQTMDKDELLVYIGKLRADHVKLLKKVSFLESFLGEIVEEVKQTEEYKTTISEQKLKAEQLTEQYSVEEFVIPCQATQN